MPFQITTQPFGLLPDATEPLVEYLLEHTESGEFIRIVPGFGGILRQLVLRKGHHRFQVMEAPDSPQALMADESYASAFLYPFPSRIRHGIYLFDGEAYTLKMNEVRHDNALHGFVQGQPFAVVSQETTATYAQLVIRHTYDGDRPGYPFPFTLTVTYTFIQADLLPNGNHATDDRMCALQLNYSALNTGISPAPAAFGWHPYFTLSEEPVDEMALSLPNAHPGHSRRKYDSGGLATAPSRRAWSVCAIPVR